ncbi:MAG: DUF4960 domain-containing protein [Prevotella sp.]|nr:DUF4960 domain-containing protein [Prevotella sp.]MBR6945012.1 DUF4960 domain-containing protein [Prevotella sp.]
MKKIYLGFIALLCIVTSCKDVEYDAATYSEAVTDLTYTNPEGTREVTLSWTNPKMAGQSGIQIIKNDKDIIDIDEVVSSYYIKKAPVNEPVSYTVKAKYSDGRVSEGQTVRMNIAYEKKTGGNMIAMLVPTDYTQSDDEKDAVAWFNRNYVNTGKGILLTPSNVDNLDIEEHTACWVMCDRIGVALGWENLPGGLASTATIEALKAFTADGGNLFLTNHATQLTVAVGRIADNYKPGIFGSGEGGQNPDIWGVQPIIGNAEGQIYDHSGHDIYRGMDFVSGLYERSIYTFEGAGVKGDHNCMWDLNSYGLAPNPNVVKAWEDMTNSTVLGTWNHVVDYCCAGIIDFAPTTTFPGRILAVGLAAYEWNLGGAVNEKQNQLEKFTANCLSYVGTPADQKVAMLVPSDYTQSDDEKDAVAWFQKNYVDAGKGVLFTPATIDDLDIEQHPMCWVMCDRIGVGLGWENLPGDLASTATIEALKAYAADGGNLLLTNHATQLTVAVGRIADNYKPGIFGSGEGGQNPDIWGVQPIIGNAEGQIYDHSHHDIYWGMDFVSGLYERSIYTFEGAGVKGDHNCMWDLNSYGLAPNPNVVKAWEDMTNSTVLGTWNHVVDYCCAGIIDFAPTTTFPGRILAVGLAAYEWNLGGAVNEKQDQLEKFTANCISYLK